MKIATKIVFCFLLVLSLGFAQDVPQPAVPVVPVTAQAVVSYQPQFFLAAGAGMNKTDSPQAQGFLTLGVKLSDLNFTATNLVMTSKTSAITQDFGHYLIQENGFTLAGLIGGGVASGGGSVGGSVGGGLAVTYDISKYTKIPHTGFVAQVKVDKTSGADVKPTFLFGVVLGLGK